MKKNIMIMLFSQLIPARIPKIKQKDGSTIDGVEIPARVITMEFRDETTNEVTAESVGLRFVQRLVDEQTLRPLQGKEGFHTSKPITVSAKLIAEDGKELFISTEMKFTINTDRMLKCVDNATNVVAMVTRVLTAPEWGAPRQAVLNYIQSKPSDVKLMNAVKQEEVVTEPKVKKARKPRKSRAKVVEMIEA